jgi:adenosine deaminase
VPENLMKTCLILSVDRRHGLEDAQEIVDLAIKYQAKDVVGVDLCGDPAKGPLDHLTPAFIRAKDARLNLTLHFAEAPVSATDDELALLLSWNPDRLGHVINVNDSFKQQIVQRNIGVELCLSCNVHAKMITGSYSDHHFGWWKDSGVGLALSVCIAFKQLVLSDTDAVLDRRCWRLLQPPIQRVLPCRQAFQPVSRRSSPTLRAGG